MLPYKEGDLVQVDPTVPDEQLRFGNIPLKSVRKQIGIIIKAEYFQVDRCMTYLVRFQKCSIWFKEKELI